MSTLIIMTFDTEDRAFDVLEEIKKDEKEKKARLAQVKQIPWTNN